MDDPGQALDGIAHPYRGQSTNEQLALGADVEEPTAEAQGHGQASEDVGGRGHQALTEGIDCLQDWTAVPCL